MASRGDQMGGRMIVGYVEAGKADRPLPFGQHAKGGLVREQSLADPLWAADEPGVVEPAGLHAVEEGPDRLVMSVEGGHGRGPVKPLPSMGRGWGGVAFDVGLSGSRRPPSPCPPPSRGR